MQREQQTRESTLRGLDAFGFAESVCQVRARCPSTATGLAQGKNARRRRRPLLHHIGAVRDALDEKPLVHSDGRILAPLALQVYTAHVEETQEAEGAETCHIVPRLARRRRGGMSGSKRFHTATAREKRARIRNAQHAPAGLPHRQPLLQPPVLAASPAADGHRIEDTTTLPPCYAVGGVAMEPSLQLSLDNETTRGRHTTLGHNEAPTAAPSRRPARPGTLPRTAARGQSSVPGPKPKRLGGS